MPVVINLLGSAGCGKSTTALGLTYSLRLLGYKVEYVPEYAKDLVASGQTNILSDQLYVFAKQLKKLKAYNKPEVDFIVTDSPLILSAFYGRKYSTVSDTLISHVKDCFNSFTNINIFLERTIPFDEVLRLQTEEEADQDSLDLLQMLREFGIPSHTLRSDKDTVNLILKHIYAVEQNTHPK